jgi:hypothetical protein
MPAMHGSKARMLLSGWEVTSSMRGASTPASADLAESSTWGMTSKRYTPSDNIDGSLQGDGVWESGAAGVGSIDELLGINVAGAHVATHLPQGDGLGNRARIIGGAETSFELDSPGDDVTGFSFEITPTATGGFSGRARVLQPLAGALNITATGNGSTLDDLGAGPPTTTTRGLGAALHVINKGGGAGTLTVKVQHSTDGSAWVDLITFAGVTAKNLAQYLEVTGTINRYLRAIWTLTGGTWDIHVAAGRK